MEIKEIWYAGMIFILRQHTTLRLQYKKKSVSQEKKVHYDRDGGTKDYILKLWVKQIHCLYRFSSKKQFSLKVWLFK